MVEVMTSEGCAKGPTTCRRPLHSIGPTLPWQCINDGLVA